MSAERSAAEVDTSAQPVTNGSAGPTLPVEQLIARQLDATPRTTQTNDGTGSTTGRSPSAPESPTSNSFATPSRRSTKPYRLPRNVREFAAQANIVANAILNGTIDLDTARAYSAVARTVAQAITAETTHARFLRTAPDLDFPTMEDE